MGPDGSLASISLWLHWLVIARRAADASRQARPSDEMVDALSARIAGQQRELPDEPNAAGNQEMLHAMVAISASAHSIDGFYGAVVEQINPRKSSAKRNRQILEALKLGFSVGRPAHTWLGELDWLFGIRDDTVHHGERLRPSVVSRYTAETVVFSGPEAFNLSSQSARRAADLATAVITECIAHPKAKLRPWSERARDLMANTLGPPPKQQRAGS
jgi:hypothetical protein